MTKYPKWVNESCLISKNNPQLTACCCEIQGLSGKPKDSQNFQPEKNAAFKEELYI